MSDSWCLDVLPCEILLAIFDYLDIIDLLQISQVCKRFYEILKTNSAWIKLGARSLVTNQVSEKFRKWCNPILSAREQCVISFNWQYGKYYKNAMFKNEISMPWLQLTDKILWWCGGNYISGIKRSEQLITKALKKRSINEKYMATEFTKFVLWKDYIISAHSNGNIKYWINTPYKNEFYIRFLTTVENAHSSYINAIDATSQNVISGSDDGIIKIQKNISTLDEYNNNTPKIHTNIKDRVQSLMIDPTETRMAIGSCGLATIPSLHIVDIEYHTFMRLDHKWRYGAGILDIVWDNPHTLLTCGYDSHIRKWDLRIGKCVNSWMDPNDATLYCIASDYQYTMITGTQYNCMAVLWDQRQNNFSQVYYVNPRSTFPNSPIYSVRFDSSHLYCTTDRYIVEMNFSNHLCQENNYKKIYALYEEKYKKYR